jgi:LPS sulfotransferase NodH
MRYIILASARSGSTHLAYLLAQHPDVSQYFEIFHPNLRARAEVRGRIASDNEDWILFVNWAFSEVSKVARSSAIGFKLMYQHATEGKPSSVWAYLAQLEDLQVIHIVRRNLLEAYASRRFAERSQIWHARPRDRIRDHGTITLSPEDCNAYFEKVLARRSFLLTLFSDRAITNVDYDMLRWNQQSVLAEVFSTLRVGCRISRPTLSKIENLSMRDRIDNYAELRAAFCGTEYEHYFTSES